MEVGIMVDLFNKNWNYGVQGCLIDNGLVRFGRKG